MSHRCLAERDELTEWDKLLYLGGVPAELPLRRVGVGARSGGSIPTPAYGAAVESPAGGAEGGALLALQRVSDDLLGAVPHRLRGTTHRSVQHGADIRRAVSAHTKDLKMSTIIESTGDGPASYHDATNLALRIGH